jgi:hypothetical protein
MFWTVPINPQPAVLIDLTAKSIAAGDIGGKVVGLTPRTPQVTDSGVVATSSTAAKGKMMIHSIKKGLQIMESKLKKKRRKWKH